MQKKQLQINGFNHPKCLTQSRSPKYQAKPVEPQIIKQITQLIKSSKDRHTERQYKPSEKSKPNQVIQPQITSRPTESRDISITFHQLLQEFRNQNKQNKENSFNNINKPSQKVRQISFPNTVLLSNTNSRTRIKDSMYLNQGDCNDKLTLKLQSIAHNSQIQNNDKLRFNGVIENMYRCSQEYQNLLIEMKDDLKNKDSHFRKSSQRCVSADIQLLSKSPIQKSRSSSIDHKESRFLGSTQANSNPKDLDLTCDENEIVINNVNIEDRIKTEPDPLIQQERDYLTDPYYLTEQSDINQLMRAILIDWMMEVAMEFRLKRQTFHLSIFYLDSYLSKRQVNKQNLQLIGLASLLIANKVEEVIPIGVKQFEKAANYGYTKDEILNMELTILFTLKWHVNPPSYTYWINWFTDQWDIYAENYGLNVQFRKPNEESYQLFRKLCQLVDCTLMDIQTLQYMPRTIVASFMYLIISFQLNVYDQDMLEIMSQTSMFLLNKDNQFNIIFGQFVQTTFGFALQDILPAIQYAVGFYELNINYETPPGVVDLSNTPLESNYEEFLSFQCYSKSLLEYIRHKSRD
ncbi:unnamed protein product [Paramecium pentaurelia]|uniref:Cyclin-like domain-containing protein n=2 Tax=Paramecium pentaurelia TaxID=43138 RepID=A0A8S1TXB8_9CILI|nr:unnamed protein product [Paramecium pentaurelia]